MRRLVPVLALVTPVVVAAACYGPTSMRVEVLTDIACDPVKPTRALLYAGSETEALADTSACTPVAGQVGTNTLGDILFAPKDDRNATVRVRVTAAIDGADPNVCATDKSKCVFASRRFTYIEHESRSLGVRLYRACVGVVCGADRTCVPNNGTNDPCVPDEVKCQGSACGLVGETPLSASPVDAGSDAAVVDAAVPEASVTPTCLGPDKTDLVLGLSYTPAFVAASKNAFYYLDSADPNAANTILKVDRASLQPQAPPASAPTFTAIRALAADDTKPYIVRDVPGKGEVLVSAGELDRTVSQTLGTRVSLAVAPAVNGSNAYVGVDSALYEIQPSGGAINKRQAPGPITDITYAGAYVYTADTVGGASFFTMSPIIEPTPIAGTAGIQVLATDGKQAFGAAGPASAFIATVSASNAPNKFATATVPVPPGGLAADGSHVYWVEGARILRSGPAPAFDGTPIPAVTLTTGTQIQGLHVDPGPGGCIFAWVQFPGAPVTNPSSLRVWKKP